MSSGRPGERSRSGEAITAIRLLAHQGHVRRVLLVWHLAFHAHIFTLMNVGQFQTGMLACTFAFLQGHEIATLLRITSCSYAVLTCRSSQRIGVAS